MLHRQSFFNTNKYIIYTIFIRAVFDSTNLLSGDPTSKWHKSQPSIIKFRDNRKQLYHFSGIRMHIHLLSCSELNYITLKLLSQAVFWQESRYQSSRAISWWNEDGYKNMQYIHCLKYIYILFSLTMQITNI